MKDSIKLTVLFEKQWWVGIFERSDSTGYTVARHIFGPEPTEVEVYQFLLTESDDLRFSRPLEEEAKKLTKKKNPKRMIREVRRSKNKEPNMSKAQDALRIELEKNKKEKRSNNSKMKEERKQQQFELKQKKKKEKQRGH